MRLPSLLFLFSFSFLFSADYYVEIGSTDNATCSQSNPCEHIQTAINLTSNGDVVIVSGGTYLENLLIETGITLKSADAADPAIIDGSSPETDPALWNGGSCIVIRTPSGASSRVTATVQDITMTGGKGTDIIEDSNHNGSFSDPEDIEKKVGGGMIVHKAGLLSRGNKIMNNGDSSTKEGGAVYAAGTGADIPDDQPADPPDDHFPNERLVIEFEETIFLGNNAQIGHTVMVNGWDPENQSLDMDFGNSQFDVAFDSENNELDGVSEYWVKGKDNFIFDFSSGITGENDAIITDVWVSPFGNDSNSGLTPDDAFLTINRALEMIYPTDDNPITIHFTEGTYAPSTTGEIYSIIMISNISMIGAGPDLTILDAEQTSRVITLNDVFNVDISSLTITGGFAQGNHYSDAIGGGIYARRSIATLNRVAITDNKAWSQGKGFYAKASALDMYNVTISNNTASEVGSCPYCWYYSTLDIVNSIIWENELFNFEDQFIFLDISYSNIQGGYEGEGNIDIDPLFVNPYPEDVESPDYSLQENSPCIDIGTDENIPYYCGIAPEMGAFEFVTADCIDECDGYIMDQCGVCDGDGQSCLDCCDIVDGDNSTCGGSGNVNGGGLNVTDIIAIVDFIIEFGTFDECQFNEADINRDGSLNILDVLVIVDWIINDSAPFAYDIDGNIYNIIEIGNQSWLKQNLKVTHYRNGDEIPTNYTGAEWVDLSSGAYSVYDSNPINANIFGNLYNYNAAIDERGICPDGFHVPSDEEWNTLAILLDPSTAQDYFGLVSLIAGGMLKETGTIEDGDGYWHEPNEGATNETGFSARGAGSRNGTSTGYYLYMGSSLYYWTTTALGEDDIIYWRLGFSNGKLIRAHWYGSSGNSIRCIQD